MIKNFEIFKKFDFFNPEADLFHQQLHLAMKESVIRSVDYDFFYEKIKMLLDSYDIIYDLNKNENYISLAIDISKIDKKKFDKELSSLLNNFGYFKSSMIDEDGEKVNSILASQKSIFKMTFQKRFDVPKNLPDILFHATTEYYYNSIKKTGLTTKAHKMVSNDLDRIYLTDNLEDAVNFCSEKRFFLKNKYSNIELFDMDLDRWVVLEVDISSIPDIKLYEDPKMANSYYTYNFIPNYAIRVNQSLQF